LLHAARLPPADVVLAQARVAGRLFGADMAGLGRFRVLDRLGRGGMGMVYAAYDPQLDRSVALKTVHVPMRGRDLALQEAKALAKLSHPNVVPVFDVGIEADQVYIVMELVRGQTLRDWVIGKDLRSIVDAYRQAGQALAAAHDAHLVHRDFKPDNAIVGIDGRVRVVDFGLACEAPDPAHSESAPVRSAAGTPKYMAPEQRSHGAITAAVDQYSFCASLAEALRAPLPAWIEAVVVRGRSQQPSDRFASMHELLRALGRDPMQRRRRHLAVAGIAAAVTAATASIAMIAFSAKAPEPCSGAQRELDATWPIAAQRFALARISALSPYGQSLVGILDPQLANYRARWTAGHRNACLAQRAGELSTRLFDRRIACLDQSRAAFATVAQLASQATGDDLANLARAATVIPDPHACGNLVALASDVEPPSLLIAVEVKRHRDELARARIQLAAANYGEARTIAAHTIRTARSLGYRPLLAEALLVQGHTLLQSNQRADGISALREATRLALEVHDDDLAVEAWARRAWLEGTDDEFSANALEGIDVITALAARSSAAFPRALLYNNLGSIELGKGNRVAAKTAFERAIEEAKNVTGPGKVELIHSRQNLALAVDDERQADLLLVDAHRELAAMLGSQHPDVLMVDYLRATVVVTSLPRVEQALWALCVQLQHYPSLSFQTAECWVELADVRAELGNRAGSVSALDQAFAAKASEQENFVEARGYRLLWQGEVQRAAAAFASALSTGLPNDAARFGRYVRAKLMLGLARARMAQGRFAEAIALLDPVTATLLQVFRDNPASFVRRRLGRAQAELARAQARTGGDAKSNAALALAWFRRSDAPAAELAELQSLLGE